MLNKIKIDLFESINILDKLASSGSPSFLEELCRFLNSDLNLDFTLIAEENSRNEFSVIGRSSNIDDYWSSRKYSIKDYKSFEESIKYENNIVCDCKLNDIKPVSNLQSIILFGENKTNFLLILNHKILASESDKEKYYIISKFVQNILNNWKKTPQSEPKENDIKSFDFLSKTNKGIIKELKTVSGLLTLIKEEQISSNVEKYVDEIKIINQSMLDSVNDLSTLLEFPSSTPKIEKTKIIPHNTLEKLLKEITEKNKNINFDIKKEDTTEIITDLNLFEYVIHNSAKFITSVSKTQNIEVFFNISSDNKLYIEFSTVSSSLVKEKLNSLAEPFEIKKYSKNQSGLVLSLLFKYMQMLNGSIKFNVKNEKVSINLSLPTKNNINNSIKIAELPKADNRDKILVIESDRAASSLLNNYLFKWNYHTEIVSSGDQALMYLKNNKYVAVILNVEQENENSLELLQRIKNNKSTRNIPVIVFSVEAEKEKIYLMGSVEYLVKPINYNNLVEILTSYKLRRNSTVLCVDDDKPTLNLLKQAVQTAGFNVVAEHRPELVENIISDRELDLAIIDLDMPILNGFDLIKQIKSIDNFSKLPIIIYTGKEDYQEDLQKIDGMFVDLLDKKSTSFNELESTITAMIKSYEEPKSIDETTEKSDGPKILMAEDYKHSQIIVTRLLKKSGFENIIVVENGEEALHICEKDKIDLILMDMQMPVMNGFEATGKIRELEGYADTPIIALTAFAMKGDREKCLEAGTTDYIPKPIDSKEFIEKVKYYTQVSIVQE